MTVVRVLDAACFLGATFCGTSCAWAAASLAGAVSWPGFIPAAAAAGVLWAYSTLECGLVEQYDPQVFDSGQGWLIRFLAALVAAVQGPFIAAWQSGAPRASAVGLLACCVWVLAGYAGLAGSVRERGVFPPWAGVVVPFWFGLPAVVLSGCPAFVVPAWLVVCLAFRHCWLSLALRVRVFAPVERAG